MEIFHARVGVLKVVGVQQTGKCCRTNKKMPAELPQKFPPRPRVQKHESGPKGWRVQELSKNLANELDLKTQKHRDYRERRRNGHRERRLNEYSVAKRLCVFEAPRSGSNRKRFGARVRISRTLRTAHVTIKIFLSR